jgi:predicted  nucleic acid-binding Zn-ribbon protein
LAAATRRADSAEAAAAEAEATAEAASRAAVDADAACAKIQKAAGDRASAAEARAHSADRMIDDLRLEKMRLTDELRDARTEARNAAVDAAAARAALDEASESIGEAQTGAHSTHVELVEARMETAKVRGRGRSRAVRTRQDAGYVTRRRRRGRCAYRGGECDG